LGPLLLINSKNFALEVDDSFLKILFSVKSNSNRVQRFLNKNS
jgi:hypothetical protein